MTGTSQPAAYFRRLLCCTAAFALGCDLPTDADEARDRLGRGVERVVPFEIPIPAIKVDLREQLAEFAADNEVIDTSDLSLRLELDPFEISFRDHLAFDDFELETFDQSFEIEFDPIEPEPVEQSLDLEFDPIEVDPVHQAFDLDFEPAAPAPFQQAFELEFDPITLDPIEESYDLSFDPAAPPPTEQSFDMEVDPFDLGFGVDATALPVTLPDRGTQVPLPPAPINDAELATDVGFGDAFSTATFAGGSRIELELQTGPNASLDQLDAVIRTIDGDELATSENTITMGASDTDTLFIPVGGLTMPDTFQVVLRAGTAHGTGSTDDLEWTMRFADATVTQATGMDADLVGTVTVDQQVALDAAGSDDFSEAELASGNLVLQSFQFGSLEFTPGGDFETDLAGKRVGGTEPDSVRIQGTVGPPAGVDTVTVVAQGDVVVRLENLEVEWATLNDVDFTFSQSVAVLPDNGDPFDDVESVDVETGSIAIEVHNRLPVGGTVNIDLSGAQDAQGDPITHTANIQAAVGPQPAITEVIVPLNGARLIPADLQASVNGTFAGTDVTITSAAADSAIYMQPTFTLVAAAATLTTIDFTFSDSVNVVDPANPDFENVTWVQVDTGTVELRILNWLPVPGQLDVVLVGSEGPDGAPVQTSAAIAAGEEHQPSETVVQLDLAGATLQPSELSASATGSFQDNMVTITRGQADGGVTIEPSFSFAFASAELADLDFQFDETVAAIDDGDSDFTGIEWIVMDTGAITLEVTNHLPVDGQISILLDGSEDQHGQPIEQDTVISAAQAGMPATTSVRLELAGARLDPNNLEAQVTGTFGGQDVEISAAAAAEGVNVESTVGVEIAAIIADLSQADIDLDSLTFDLVQPGDTTFAGVIAANVDTGSVQLRVVNHLPVDIDLEMHLEGATEANGDPLVRTGTINASPDGTPVETVLQLDLAGARMEPEGLKAIVFGELPPGTVTLTQDAANQGMEIEPTITISVESVEVDLAEADFAFDTVYINLSDEIDSSDLDAVEYVTVDTGAITISAVNHLPIDLELQIDFDGVTGADGQPVGMVSTINASPDGLPQSTTLRIDLAGATLEPNELQATIIGNLGTDTVTITRAAAEAGITVSSLVALEIASITADLQQTDMAFDTLHYDLSEELGEDAERVSAVRLLTGSLKLEAVNHLPVDIDLNLDLAGATDAMGNPVQRDITIARSPDGSPVTSSISIELDGATLYVADLQATIIGDLSAGLVTVTTAAMRDGIRITPSVEIEVDAIEVESAFDIDDFDEFVEITMDDLGLDEIRDMLEGTELMDVQFEINARNTTGIGLSINGLNLALRHAADTSQVLDDNDLPVQLESPLNLMVPPGGEVNEVVDATRLINHLIQAVLAGDQVGLLAEGGAGTDEEGGEISLDDEIQISFRVLAPLHLSLPPDGISLNRAEHAVANIEMESTAVVDDLKHTIRSGGVTFKVTNATPLGVTIDVAFAPSPADSAQYDDFDPFESPSRFVIQGIAVEPAEVDSEGAVKVGTDGNLIPRMGQTAVDIPTEDLDVLFNADLSMGLRIRLLAGEEGLIKIEPANYLELRPTLYMEAVVGSNR